MELSAMRNKLSIVLGVAALLLSGQRGFTADATAELKALVTKINADISAGKRTETSLADDLKQFDVLLAEHKGEKTDAVAKILYMKATLYGEVLQNDAKAKELVEQLKADFKDTQFVARLEKQEAAAAAAKRIQDSLVVGATFPDFNETDVAGQPLSIAGHKGKVVLLDFWATWCTPCRIELPNVIAAYQKYHAKGFDIIGVSLDEDKAQLLGFIKDQNMSWPQFFDGQRWDNKLAVKYGVQSIPAAFLLDGEGKIIGKNLRGDALDRAVAGALADK
jgi:thiol-disulfide isomerase/thioredoxin